MALYESGPGPPFNKGDSNFFSPPAKGKKPAPPPIPHKGGYDYDFVSPPPKTLECSICLLTLKDPHVISCCGNHYCKPCIERVQRDKKPCPLCNEPDYNIMLHKGVMREVNSLAVYCPQKKDGCPWSGDMGKLKCHENIGSRDSGCGYVKLDCKHKCGGRFPRKDIARHENELCLSLPAEKQFEQLASQMSAAIGELNEKVSAVTVKNIELQTKYTAVISTNKVLEAKNTSLEASMKDMIAKVDIIESEKETLKSRVAMLETLAKKVFRVENRQTGFSKRLDEVEDSMTASKRDLENQCVAIETRLTPTPPFYFMLRNFPHYQKADFNWESEPFYAFPRGYKLQVTVYPNGTNKSRGNFLSVFVSLMRGEYDDELEWPFIGVMHIDIYNTLTKNWDPQLDIEFEGTDGIQFTGRPKESLSNPGLGIPSWLPLEEVHESYCHKGTVRFRVAKVTVRSYCYLAVE